MLDDPLKEVKFDVKYTVYVYVEIESEVFMWCMLLEVREPENIHGKKFF